MSNQIRKLISIEQLMAYCISRGHQVDRINQIWVEDIADISTGDGLNIKVSSNNFGADLYNDAALLIEHVDGKFKLLQYAWGTNEPGIYYTQNRLNPNGAARIAFGYHRVWTLGLHRGYPALTQCRDLKVFRDANENGIRDDRLVTASANSGINIHHGGDSTKIGRYSAGCLVRQQIQHHEEFMALMRKYPNADKLYGVSVVDPIALFDWVEKN